MSDSAVLGPDPLGPSHEPADFDCGVVSLNSYLSMRALADQRAGKSRTYVVTSDEGVVGYFSLAAGAVAPPQTGSRLAKGQGAQPIPVVLLARLAVDSKWKGRGLGEGLLVEALARSAAAAEVIGARAVLVHAIDERARSFYVKYGFESLPTDDMHLVLLMKDIRKTLGL